VPPWGRRGWRGGRRSRSSRGGEGYLAVLGDDAEGVALQEAVEVGALLLVHFGDARFAGRDAALNGVPPTTRLPGEERGRPAKGVDDLGRGRRAWRTSRTRGRPLAPGRLSRHGQGGAVLLGHHSVDSGEGVELSGRRLTAIEAVGRITVENSLKKAI
jgi:hypothetical protein